MKTCLSALLLTLSAAFLVTACSSDEGTTPDCQEPDLSDCFTMPDGGSPVRRDAGGTTD